MNKTIFILIMSSLVYAQNPVTRIVICTDAGSTDAYACTASPTLGAYSSGLKVRLYPNTANTGAATVNIDSLGAKTIKKVAGGITTDLADNDIRAGQYVELIYDGTNMQMLSQLGNASTGGGSGVGMVASMTQASLAASGDGIYGPYGTTTATTYLRLSAPWPVSCTAQKLYVSMGSAQASGGTLSIALYKNGADTSLTCAVSAGSQTCSDTSNTVSISAGDLIAIHAHNNSTTGPSQYFNVAWSCQ